MGNLLSTVSKVVHSLLPRFGLVSVVFMNLSEMEFEYLFPLVVFGGAVLLRIFLNVLLEGILG